MTIATLRPDGWPQATTVGYVRDGLKLYFLCGAQSQKARNLAGDRRVSVTIDHDTSDPLAIAGLSMAAYADAVTASAEVAAALGRIPEKFPEYKALGTPQADQVRVFRLTPVVVSVLDYSKGFGHADLVAV
jgi:nitroimidazol reductase NimA-like FMN-containing flavoprotein (pyridoxamine 5'-phosphate oxidase superfamily)